MLYPFQALIFWTGVLPQEVFILKDKIGQRSNRQAIHTMGGKGRSRKPFHGQELGVARAFSIPKRSVKKNVGFKGQFYFLLSLIQWWRMCWESHAQFMNITISISQLCNPAGQQRLKAHFTFSSLSSSVRIKQRAVGLAFPSSCLLGRQDLRKAAA